MWKGFEEVYSLKRLLESIQQQIKRLRAGRLFALLTQPTIFPILIFTFAFCVRAFYVAHCHHLICEFGDAFYYLTTGAALAKELATTTDWNSLFQHLTLTTPISPEDGTTFTSSQLPVRLMLDGPIYPAYLAMLASIFGFASQTKMQFNTYGLQIGMANSFIDSLSCVMIYFVGSRAFGRKIGAVAAFLFALYPAATINLTRAYSETFSYFLVLGLLSTVLIARFEKLKTASLCGIALQCGLLSASVALVRPMFLLVVAAVFASLLLSDRLGSSSTQWIQSWTSKRRLAALALASMGAFLIFFPWTQITTKSLGKPTLLLSRAPAYNLFVGNQLSTDGWKTWPIVPGANGNVGVVVNGIVDNLKKHPLEMIALELKKVPRLWAGGWNEFRYPFFGLSFEMQNIWHCVLLFFAFVGICLTASQIFATRYLPTLYVGLSSALIIFIHFLYIGFEPISRYNLTAMPFVCLFCGVAIVKLLQRLALFSLLLMVAGSGALFWLLQSRVTCAPVLLQNFPTMSISTAHLLEELGILVLWFFLCRICIRGIAAAQGPLVFPKSSLLVTLCFAFASLSWFSASHFSLSAGEWFCDIRTQMQTISQDATIPGEKELAEWLSETKGANALDPKNTIFLLVDLEHAMGQPAVTLAVNRVTWRTFALPWNQVLGKEGDFTTIMYMQGSAMTRDWRSFRQWWAIPIPRGLLHPGQPNEISLGFAFAEAPLPVRLFGDYFPTENTDSLYLPSFDLFSWTRGFATYDTRDMRVFELTPGLCKMSNPALWFVRVSETKDLSTEPGLQSGAYRIRFAMPRSQAQRVSESASKPEPVPVHTAQAVVSRPESSKLEPSKTESLSPEASKLEPLKPEQFEEFAPVSLLKSLEEITVDGSNPLSYWIFKKSQKLPATIARGSVIDFGCLIKSDRKRQAGPISLVIEAENDKGEIEKFTSPWQPTAVAVDTDWRRFHTTYAIPDRMFAMKNLSVSVAVTPFPIDELYLNKREAVREVMIVKDANLTLYAPLQMPAGKLDWMIF